MLSVNLSCLQMFKSYHPHRKSTYLAIQDPLQPSWKLTLEKWTTKTRFKLGLTFSVRITLQQIRSLCTNQCLLKTNFIFCHNITKLPHQLHLHFRFPLRSSAAADLQELSLGELDRTQAETCPSLGLGRYVVLKQNARPMTHFVEGRRPFLASASRHEPRLDPFSNL